MPSPRLVCFFAVISIYVANVHMKYTYQCGTVNDCTGLGPKAEKYCTVRRKRDVNSKFSKKDPANPTLDKWLKFRHPKNSSRRSGDDYINSGWAVNDYTYPWYSLLTYYDVDTVCNGVLISKRHLLSAMYCFPYLPEYSQEKTMSSNAMTAYFGLYTSGASWTYTTWSYIESAYVFPSAPVKEGVTNGRHEFLILVMKSPVEFQYGIRPICLPIDGIVPEGEYSLIGMGNTVDLPDKRKANTLYERKNVKVTFDATASEKPEKYFYKLDSHSDSPLACMGDQGDALMWRNPFTNRMVLAGVLTRSYGDCDLDRKYKQSLTFARVSYFTNQIIQFISLKESKYLKDLDNYLDGSLSQPRYYGYASQFDLLKNEYKDVMTQPPPPDKKCIDHKYGAIKCRDDAENPCIRPQAVCDGINDCADGFDESPHLCTGKCDWFHQHQFAGVYYSDATDLDIPMDKEGATPQECKQHCMDLDNCTHYQWTGLHAGKHHKFPCKVLGSTNPNGEEDFSLYQGESDQLVVRGPKYCGDGKSQCEFDPWLQYKSGFFQIQAMNGQFLSHAGGDNKVKGIAVRFKNLTFARPLTGPYNWTWPLFFPDGNEIINVADYEFLFEFTGKPESLERSSFKIYRRSDKAYLTAKPEGQIRLETKVAGDESQTWYMEGAPVRDTESLVGFTEVRLFTRTMKKYIDTQIARDSIELKRYLAIGNGPFALYYNKHKEGTPKHPDPQDINVHWEEQSALTAGKNDLLTRFRILYCGHHKPQEVPGNKRKFEAPFMARDKLNENSFNDETYPAFGVTADIVPKDGDKRKQWINLVYHNLEYMTSIWEYATKMRLSEEAFSKMYKIWRTESQEFPKNPEIKELIREYIKDGFLVD